MAATESDKVSYANLIRFTKLSLKFAPEHSNCPPPTKHFNVQLHYCDEDGDKVLFSSDVELMDALSWAASSEARGNNAPTLVVHATILPLSRRPSNASTTTSASIGSARSLMVQQHRVAETNSSTRSLPVKSNGEPLYIEGAASTTTGAQSSLGTKSPLPSKGGTQRKPNPLASFLRRLLAPLPTLIKGGTELDASCNSSVGEAFVGRLANALGSAAAFVETQENNTQGKLASLHSERAIKAGVAHLAPLHRPDCKGYKRIVVSPPSLNTEYVADFVHKRHECDGCHMDPIVGFRYHTIPNVDLCERCFDTALMLSNSGNNIETIAAEDDRKPPSEIEIKAEGEESDEVVNDDDTITFEMVQYESDQGLIHSSLANMLLRMRNSLKSFAKSQKEQLGIESTCASDYDHTALEDSSRVSDFDVAVAIQKSLQDLRKKRQVEDISTCENGDDSTHVTEAASLSPPRSGGGNNAAALDCTGINDDENSQLQDGDEWCIVND